MKNKNTCPDCNGGKNLQGKALDCRTCDNTGENPRNSLATHSIEKGVAKMLEAIENLHDKEDDIPDQ